MSKYATGGYITDPIPHIPRDCAYPLTFGKPPAKGDGPDAPLHRHNEVTEAVRRLVTPEVAS